MAHINKRINSYLINASINSRDLRQLSISIALARYRLQQDTVAHAVSDADLLFISYRMTMDPQTGSVYWGNRDMSPQDTYNVANTFINNNIAFNIVKININNWIYSNADYLFIRQIFDYSMYKYGLNQKAQFDLGVDFYHTA